MTDRANTTLPLLSENAARMLDIYRQQILDGASREVFIMTCEHAAKSAPSPFDIDERSVAAHLAADRS